MKNYPEILRSIGGYFDEAAQREISCAEVADHIEKLEAEREELIKSAKQAIMKQQMMIEELAALRQQQSEPVAEIVLESMGVPGSDAMRARIHFFKNIPPPGTKLYREAAPKQQGKPVAVVSDESDYDFRQYLKCAEHLPFGTKLYREAAPRVPEGWRLVPVEPTEELSAALQHVRLTDWTVSPTNPELVVHLGECSAHDIYLAMLAAAPGPKE